MASLLGVRYVTYCKALDHMVKEGGEGRVSGLPATLALPQDRLDCRGRGVLAVPGGVGAGRIPHSCAAAVGLETPASVHDETSRTVLRVD